jgi:hypothetical protein
MSQIGDEMKSLEKEIDVFIRNYPNVTATSFPLHEYKLLNEKLVAINIKMACPNSGVHVEEGNKWFIEQIQKLTKFIP